MISNYEDIYGLRSTKGYSSSKGTLCMGGRHPKRSEGGTGKHLWLELVKKPSISGGITPVGKGKTRSHS